MFHHDERDYDTAAGEAARAGRQKLEEIIEKGRATAERVVEDVATRVIRDRLVRAPHVRLALDEEEVNEYLSVGGELLPLHDHARGQLLANVGVPKLFALHLAEDSGGQPWGRRLLAENVNTILAHREDQTNLVRQEGGESGLVKGFLSDRFKRMDSRPLLDAFLGACKETGMLPYEGVCCDTKCRVRAVLPYVFEPIANEVMIFGAEFGNSDYGDGGVTLNLFTTRVWCTNLAVTTKCLRKVHLGRRLDEFTDFSERTRELDNMALASALADGVGDLVGPDRVNRMLDAIRTAGEKEIKGQNGIDKILERAIGSKSEFAQIKALYDGPDVVNLPPGETVWRLSNAVSFFAQRRDLSNDRRLELQSVAGNILAS